MSEREASWSAGRSTALDESRPNQSGASRAHSRTLRAVLIAFLLSTFLAFSQSGLRSPPFVAELKPRPAAGGAPPQPDIAWWVFSENTGTSVADTSTRGTNTLALGGGGSMWVAGVTGFAIKGNGSTQYGYLPSLNSLTNVITITYWIKDAAWSAGLEIQFELDTPSAGADATFVIYNSDTVLDCFLFSSAPAYRAEEMAVPSTATWHHLGVVINDSTTLGDIRMWLDGVEQSLTLVSNSKNGAAVVKNAELLLLSRYGSSLFSDAAIDDVRIYTGDRSADMSAIMADPR